MRDPEGEAMCTHIPDSLNQQQKLIQHSKAIIL